VAVALAAHAALAAFATAAAAAAHTWAMGPLPYSGLKSVILGERLVLGSCDV